MFRWSVTQATICYNFISWSSLCSELWSWIVCPSEKTRKKWQFLKRLILIKFYFHLDAHVKIRLLGEYQHHRWRNNGQGGLNSIFNFLTLYLWIFIFSWSTKFNRKTAIKTYLARLFTLFWIKKKMVQMWKLETQKYCLLQNLKWQDKTLLKIC
jgi:hypothetical protein